MNVYWIVYTPTCNDSILPFYGNDTEDWGDGWIKPSTSIIMIIGGNNE